MNGKRHAVVIVNLGGPFNLGEVKPFLKKLFQDPDIFHFPFGKIGQRFFSSMVATLRAPVSKKYYAAIGGTSPLHANTVAQATKLQKFLQAQGVDFTVFTAQRYWHPSIAEAVAQIMKDMFSTVTLIPLFPQYSTTTTQSVINEWNRLAVGLPNAFIIKRFYREDGFIRACEQQIKRKLKDFNTPPHILFSAHSIPVKRVLDGDSYESEITECMELIIDRLGREYSYSLCYQSKVGPVKWLSPSIRQAIDDLISQEIRHVLVVPLSFVSEHVETLYELDIVIRNYALKNGIVQFERVSTVQDHDEFIGALKRLVLEVVS